jgi:hypothetical protein
MTEYSIALLVCCTVIVILAVLLYAAGRGYLSTLTGIGELRATLSQVQADTQNMDLSLRQQRRVIYDAHRRICAVTKGLQKPTS